ncbi:vanadium-dependent haloperoxidase [Paenibacillus jamilae]
MDDSCVLGPLDPKERRHKAYQIRKQAAKEEKSRKILPQPCNHDERKYPNKIGNFSKGLPHNGLGEVDQHAYGAYLKALNSGKPSKFEEIPLGGTLKLVNPQGAYVYDLAGPDGHSLTIPAPPSINSAAAASDMVELYWQSLLRDVPFNSYDRDPLAAAAAENLLNLKDFYGPEINGQVTPQTLFRGVTQGDLVGPYISQFLYKDIPFGATSIIQKYKVPLAGQHFLTDYQTWLSIQNGAAPSASIVYDPEPRFLRNGRDLSEWVHKDFSYQGVLMACLYLLSLGSSALDPANPYFHSRTQTGFVTFGSPYILDLVARAANFSMESAWYQKFLVHRRLRPEEFGGLVQQKITNNANYPIHEQLLNSPAVDLTFNKYGTYLLPQAYPEGCPAHPSYPAGHAVIAGAGVTMLKAFFNEDFVLPNPVTVSDDGLSLEPFNGAPLTIGGELNKLANNFALARAFAGIHYRSDCFHGMNLGEAAAIGLLRNYRHTFNEPFCGFKLTKFDGTTIIVK